MYDEIPEEQAQAVRAQIIKSIVELRALLSRKRDNSEVWVEQWAPAYIVNKCPQYKPRQNDLYSLSRFLLYPIYLDTPRSPNNYLMKLRELRLATINYPLQLLQFFFEVVEQLLTVLVLNEFVDIYAKLPLVFKNTVEDFIYLYSNRSLFDWIIVRQKTFDRVELNHLALDVPKVSLEVLQQLKYYLKNVQRFSEITRLQQAHIALNKPLHYLTQFQKSYLSAPESLDPFLKNSPLRYPTITTNEDLANYLSAPESLEDFLTNSPLRYPRIADRDFDNTVPYVDFLIREAEAQVDFRIRCEKAEAEPARYQVLQSIFSLDKWRLWDNSIDREWLIASISQWIKLKYADEDVELNDEEISAIYTLCKMVFNQDLSVGMDMKTLNANMLPYSLDFLELFSKELENFIEDLLYPHEDDIDTFLEQTLTQPILRQSLEQSMGTHTPPAPIIHLQFLQAMTHF